MYVVATTLADQTERVWVARLRVHDARCTEVSICKVESDAAILYSPISAVVSWATRHMTPTRTDRRTIAESERCQARQVRTVLSRKATRENFVGSERGSGRSKDVDEVHPSIQFLNK